MKANKQLLLMQIHIFTDKADCFSWSFKIQTCISWIYSPLFTEVQKWQFFLFIFLSVLFPWWILGVSSQNRRTNQCGVFISVTAFVTTVNLRVSWGSLKACFLLEEKLHQTKKKKKPQTQPPLRFNYPSPILLTRSGYGRTYSCSTSFLVLVACLVVNRSLKMNYSFFLLLPMLSVVSLLDTDIQALWWSLEKKFLILLTAVCQLIYSCLIFFCLTGPSFTCRIFFFWFPSALHQLFLLMNSSFLIGYLVIS